MNDRNPEVSTPQEVSGQRSDRRWRFAALCSLVVLIALLISRIGSTRTTPPPSPTNAVTPSAGSHSPGTAPARPFPPRPISQAALTADEVVAGKVSQFVRDRRGVVPANAVPLGPIMELGVQDGQNAFNAEQVTQSLEYWRVTAQQLLLDPEASGSPETLKTYSHMAVAQANLLAAHDHGAEAEEPYRVASQLWPANPESVINSSDLMFRTGRAEEARQMVEDFARQYPDQLSSLEASESWRLAVGAQTPPQQPSLRP